MRPIRKGSGDFYFMDDLSLLFHLKAENAQLKSVIGDSKSAATSLKSHFAGEIHNMNTVTQGVFDELTKHLNVFVGERIPLLGGAFLKVTENVRDLGKEAEGTGTSLSALGGIGGILTVGLLAAGAAAVGLAVALFEIVKKSAEAGLELEHVIEKTGLGAKTVTALKFAGDELGQSIEGLDVGMKLFSNTVAKAAEGSEQAARTLKRLGVTPKEALSDLDGTLAKIFKRIYGAPSGIEKVSLASDAFGRRIGSNLIPLIESFHGNLGELIKRADELGVTLDEKGIRSLADFERNMNALKAQTLGLERAFAVELAPTLTKLLEGLSRLLAENKERFTEWGKAAGDTIHGIALFADSDIVKVIQKVIDLTKYLSGAYLLLRAIGFAAEAARDAGASATTDPRFKSGGYDPKTGLPDDQRKIGALESGEDFIGKKKKKDTTAIDAFHEELALLKDTISEREAVYTEETANIKHQYDERLTAFDEEIAAERIANATREADALLKIAAEALAVQNAYSSKTIKLKEFEEKNRQIEKDTEKIKRETRKVSEQLDEQSYKHRIELAHRYYAEIESLAKQRDADRLTDLNNTLNIEQAATQLAFDKRLAAQADPSRRLTIEQDYYATSRALEEKYNKDIEVIRLAALDREKQLLHDEVLEIANHYAEIHKVSLAEALQSKVVTDAMDERSQKIAAIEYQRTRVIKETSDANIAAYKREAEAAKKAAEAAAIQAATAGSEGATRRRLAKPAQDLNPFNEALKQINAHFGEGTAKAAQFATALQAVESIASGVANAVGQAVYAFVLYGNSGTSIRKFTAELIANIAQMAAVQAVWEAAQGLAMLALNFFWPNPKYTQSAAAHFSAAAVYGGIAGVAAVAGRAVAGGAFAQGGAASSNSGTGGSSSGTSSQPSQSRPLVLGSQRTDLVIHKIVPPEGWLHTQVKQSLNANDPELNRMLARERS